MRAAGGRNAFGESDPQGEREIGRQTEARLRGRNARVSAPKPYVEASVKRANSPMGDAASDRYGYFMFWNRLAYPHARKTRPMRGEPNETIGKGMETMEKPSILAVVGSLRAKSFNRQLALMAGEALGERATFTVLEFADVPLLNQDFEYPAPEPVRRVREAVKAADGLWFFTPEYNHTYSGVLKNLIDWLSRPISETERQVLSQKPAAISGITPSIAGTISAQDQLVMLLSLLNMRVMNVPRVTIPGARQLADAQGNLTLGESLPFLQKQADAYLRFLQKA